MEAPEGEFEQFVSGVGPRLRRALVARFGVEMGTEAFADAMAWAWEHRDRLKTMTNPVGYLYRVGQSSASAQRRSRRRTVLLASDLGTIDGVEPNFELLASLSRLRPEQRVAVLMVHAHGASYAEVADILEISVAAVTNHVHRGIRKLRAAMEARP